MTNLENFANSYNRKVEIEILEQLDKIEQAKKDYLAKRDECRIAYMQDEAELKRQILEHQAQMSILKKELKVKIKDINNTYNIEMADLKENYQLDMKEIKQHRKLLLSKIEINYQKILKEYNQACLNKNEEAIKKRKEFKEAYQVYYLEQNTMLTKNEIKASFSCKQIYQEQKQVLFNKKQEDIKNLKEFYLQQSKRESLLKEIALTGDSTKKKELQTEVKLLNRIYVKRLEHKQAILNLKLQIKELKISFKQKEMANKTNVFELRKHYLEVKKESMLKISAIKEIAKQYYQSLSFEKQQEYKKYESLVKQNFRCRRKQRLDAIEKQVFKKVNPAYLYILPAVIGALFFTVLPFIFMLITAFFRLDLANLANSRFMGFKNFANIFLRDTEFQKALGNTAIYSLCTVVLLTIVTIGMAAWLAKNTRIHNIAQTMVFTPHIASLVSISILWIAMLNPNGIINQLLALFGIEGPGWLVQENTSLLAVSFVTVWKDIGYYVLIIIAGLQAIPSYIYEAAKLDKSSQMNTFFKLTLPLLVPTLSFVFVTKFINSFKVFAPIEIMTNGGPMGSSMVLSYWIYKVGRVGYNYGQAMAGAIVLTIIIAFCTFINYRFFRKKVTY